MKTRITEHQPTTFFVLAYGISWLIRFLPLFTYNYHDMD